MRTLSLWAKHHRFAAITLLVTIKLMLALMAFYVGAALLDLNIHIPYVTLFITMAVVAIVVLTYPSRWSATLSRKQFYFRQKTSDYIIAASSFVMIATLVNNNMTLPGTTVSQASNVAAVTTTPT